VIAVHVSGFDHDSITLFAMAKNAQAEGLLRK